MAAVGFHASHELYSPSELLDHLQCAEGSGYQAAMCSDHFHPWSCRGQSGFAWSWLGAAMQLVDLPFGVVCAPGQRYHPALIAQASATLAEMFPDRFWIAVGTGENLNEHINGDAWPAKSERQARLSEAVDIMRRLWSGETVNSHGRLRVDRARLYTLPPLPPKVFGAAVSDETAEWVGSWADGLITVAKKPSELARTVAAFRRGGGYGKPMALQAAVGWADSDEQALRDAYEKWGVAALNAVEIEDVATPEEFDRRISDFSAEDLRGKLRISSDLDHHAEWIRNDFQLGFHAVYLHFIGSDSRSLIKLFAKHVVPKALRLDTPDAAQERSIASGDRGGRCADYPAGA